MELDTFHLGGSETDPEIRGLTAESAVAGKGSLCRRPHRTNHGESGAQLVVLLTFFTSWKGVEEPKTG